MFSRVEGWVRLALMLLPPLGCFGYMALGPEYVRSPMGLAVMLVAMFVPSGAFALTIVRWRVYPFVRASARLLRYGQEHGWYLRRQPVYPGPLPWLSRFQTLLHPKRSGALIWQPGPPWAVVHVAQLGSRLSTVFLLPASVGQTPDLLLQPRGLLSPDGIRLLEQAALQRSFVVVAPAIFIPRVQKLLRVDFLGDELLRRPRLHLEVRDGDLLIHWGKQIVEADLAAHLAEVMHLAEVLRRASADAFEDGGNALAGPDAHRRQAKPGIASDHVMDQRGRDPRPGSP